MRIFIIQVYLCFNFSAPAFSHRLTEGGGVCGLCSEEAHFSRESACGSPQN